MILSGRISGIKIALEAVIMQRRYDTTAIAGEINTKTGYMDTFGKSLA
jgi:hypothetical protein